MNEDQATTEQGVTSRRSVLLGAGAVGATTVLAGCGDDSGTGTSGSGTPGATAAPTQPTDGGGALAKASDIPVGGGKIFAGQGVVVTQPVAGTFKAFSSTCTHQGCPVASVDGGTINCTCHQSKFSIDDGSVKAGPATKALPEKNISVAGESITLG